MYNLFCGVPITCAGKVLPNPVETIFSSCFSYQIRDSYSRFHTVALRSSQGQECSDSLIVYTSGAWNIRWLKSLESGHVSPHTGDNSEHNSFMAEGLCT